MARTRILATYGPACESREAFVALLEAGADVLRLNLSHLEPEALGPVVRRLRARARRAGLPLALLADMPGPKIRLSRCRPESFELEHGQTLRVAPGSGDSTPECLRIPYRRLLEDVREGHELAINDGIVLLRVLEVEAQALRVRVLRGGPVASRKGVSFPHSSLRTPTLTARDKAGLRAAAEAEVDFVALSFVRSGGDLAAARRILRRHDAGDIPLVAKIEQHEAIEQLEGILDEADGVMVARGDLGIENPLEEVPLLQKRILARANARGRFAITATQMLESMIEQARPTRAEVTDVANAILDGSDAVMLSAETAVGRHPALVVRSMDRIAHEAERGLEARDWLGRLDTVADGDGETPLDDALARAACQLAADAPLDALVCLSYYGSTARRIARYRPACPIFVLSPYERQCRRLALHWGLTVLPFPPARPTRAGRLREAEALLPRALELLLEKGLLARGRRVAFLAGIPLDAPGGTNLLRLVETD